MSVPLTHGGCEEIRICRDQDDPDSVLVKPMEVRYCGEVFPGAR